METRTISNNHLTRNIQSPFGMLIGKLRTKIEDFFDLIVNNTLIANDTLGYCQISAIFCQKRRLGLVAPSV